MSQTQVHTVTVRGEVYILAEDVASLIEELGATEPTDTRNRLDKQARNIRDSVKKLKT